MGACRSIRAARMPLRTANCHRIRDNVQRSISMTTTYALDNGRAGAKSMLDCLSAILDQSTLELLAPLVPLRGRCLELGAGNGSVAGWLGDVVGRTGRVVATDLRPDHVRAEVRSHPRVEVLQ